MEQQISQASLLHELRAARAEWYGVLAEVGEGRMTQPGAAGDWSVKDVMAHLTSYSRWFVNASEAHVRGELPPLDGTEGMDFEQRNRFWHQQTRALSLAKVQAESQRVFSRLLEWWKRTRRNFSRSRSSSRACQGRYWFGRCSKAMATNITVSTCAAFGPGWRNRHRVSRTNLAGNVRWIGRWSDSAVSLLVG